MNPDERDASVADEPSVPAEDAPAPTAKPGKPAKPERSHLPIWQETLLLLGVAVVLAVVIKAVLVQAFYIPSESMEPGLVENDRILVQKWSYWSGSPERGDVVVFEDPGGWLGADESTGPSNGFTKALAKLGLFPSGGHLVKRVIGVEGDTITCCDAEGRISVNGVALDESDYVKDDTKAACAGPMTGNCSWTSGPVPPGHVFVMGDNRSQSADSTVHMCTEGETDCVRGREFVDNDLVVGKVFVLLWPFDRFGTPDDAGVLDDVPDATS
ncbi:signal peptidase I [Nocardioides sp.]|uniref:signal peptidase I n=1 Tax=Nocardioides sp. TaxID=35761 RepID=UPI001A2E1765|nr:signal peptidase I [Nocardioides sp.]MBJ7356719.1 signal peptidase I [Nocardioides sp.]